MAFSEDRSSRSSLQLPYFLDRTLPSSLLGLAGRKQHRVGDKTGGKQLRLETRREKGGLILGASPRGVPPFLLLWAGLP
jgi:hypothetical protein